MQFLPECELFPRPPAATEVSACKRSERGNIPAVRPSGGRVTQKHVLRDQRTGATTIISKNLNCFDPVEAKTLMSNQRRKALTWLMFLKQKRATQDKEVKVKARECIVGMLQRKYINKEDAALPTDVTLDYSSFSCQ